MSSSISWKLTTAVAACVVILLAPADGRAEAGEGISAGNLSLSPGLSVNGAFNSNVFYESRQEATPTAAPTVKIVPFLTIETIEPQFVALTLDARVGWEQYIRPDSPTVTAQSGLTADVGAGVGFNQDGAVSFRIQERLTRTNEPPSNPARLTYNRTLNQLGGTFGVHPGGKVFQHYLGYNWYVYRHDELIDLNRMMHAFSLKNYYRFLPKTAFVLTGDYRLVNYESSARAGGFANQNSTPLRVTGGLTGLITKRLALRIIGGYGWGFYDGPEDFRGLIVDTQLQYLFGVVAENNRLFLGYERDFQDTSISSFASFHRPYAGYEQSFANNRFRLSLKIETVFRNYVGAPSGDFEGPAGTVTIDGELEDVLVRGHFGADFAIQKWWLLNLNYTLSSNLTDDLIVSSVPGNDALREYTRHYVTFGTTLKY